MVKKINLNKKLKNLFIVLSIIIIIAMAVLIYIEYKIPSFQEEKVSLYSYTNKADIKHSVSFRPNMLYDEGFSAAGEIYLMSYIENINTVFQYQFLGEREGDITGNYKITAEVEGYTGEKENYKTIWRKLFTLVPVTSIQDYNRNLLIEREIPLNLNDYNSFAEIIKVDSKVSSQVKLTVYMDVDLKIETDKGAVNEKTSPFMVIPLNTNYIEITKNIPPIKNAAIEETRQVQLPANQKLIIIYSVALAIMLMILLCLIFLTVGIEKDLFTKNLDKIFKKHGSRLVALNNNTLGFMKNFNKVKSIDDLVKIADELGKPIMYKYSSNYKEITQFYVGDESQVYLFDVKELVKELEKALPPKGGGRAKVKSIKDEEENITV